MRYAYAHINHYRVKNMNKVLQLLIIVFSTTAWANDPVQVCRNIANDHCQQSMRMCDGGCEARFFPSERSNLEYVQCRRQCVTTVKACNNNALVSCGK